MSDEFTNTENNPHRVDLGDRVRDEVTGAEGIVASYAKHLTGCDTITIELGITPEGKMPLVAMDVTRVSVVEKGAISKDKLPGFQNPYQDTFSGQAVPAAG